jgi:ferredoxin-NADP reductase
MQVFFESRRELVPSIWEYSFRPERRIDFVPGQYISLNLPLAATDRRGASRTFTLTSQPSDKYFTFITRHPIKQSPYKDYLEQLQLGDPASITDAMGDVVIPKLETIPIIIIAGGLGIASFVAPLNWSLIRKEKRRVDLFYARRHKYELLYPELIAAYPFKSKVLLVSPQHVQLAEVLSKATENSLFYISGSQQFTESFCMQLRTAGITNERLVFDYFDGYTDEQL